MKFSFFVIAFSLFTFQLYGQSFAPMGAEWKMLITNGFSAIDGCENNDKSVSTISVTNQLQIGGKSVSVLSNGNTELYLSEDSNRIYFYEDSAFHLYMDLNLGVGDTLYQNYPENMSQFHTDCMCSPDPEAIIAGIVTNDTLVTIDGVPLKRLYFDFYKIDTISNAWFFEEASYFTEKLGSPNNIMDFAGQGDCILADCCDDELLCYQDNQISFDYSPKSSNCVYTSVSETRLSQIEMYPNPAHDQLTIQIDQFTEVSKFYLYNIEGKIVMQQNLNQPQSMIDISGLESGFYFYGIEKDQKLIKKDRLVILD